MVGESDEISGGCGGSYGGGDSGGEDVGEQEGLEGDEIRRLKKEALEFGVEVAVEGLVGRGEDGEIVGADGVFEGGQEKGFLHKLG